MAEPSVSVRVEIDQRAIDSLRTEPETTAFLMEVGREIARTGAARARRRTGAGARSFHPEPLTGDAGGVGVSWDQLHYYMYFHEVGTRTIRAQPALTTALDQYRF